MARRHKMPTEPSDDIYGASAVPKQALREEFGRRLAAVLLKRDKSQADLARLSGLSPPYISRCINGKTMPGKLHMKKIANALNVKMEDLYPPTLMAREAGEEMTGMRVVRSVGDPGKAWLYINEQLDFSVVSEIMKLVDAAQSRKKDGKN